MITRNQALSGTTATRSTLTYIDQLITGATQQGLYYIIVPASNIDDSMAAVIRTNGYKVDKRNNFLGTNYDYIINWE